MRSTGASSRATGPLDPPAGRGSSRLPAALWLLGGAVLLFVVWVGLGQLLTHVLSHDAFGRDDTAISRWFARHRTPSLNTASSFGSDAAETQTVAAIALVTVVAARLAWNRWREAALVALAVAGETAIFLLIELVVNRHRPPVPHLDLHAPPTSSFPSGHTAASVALYGSLAVLASERVRNALLRGLCALLGVLVPVVVALSRVYRGMHYPSDVLAGGLLGACWLFVVVRGVRLGAGGRGSRGGRRTDSRSVPVT